MKPIEKLNKRKTPIVKIDNTLEKFAHNITLFRDKVDKANETLRRVGLPKNKPLSLDK